MKTIFMNRETRSIADLCPFEDGFLLTRINVPTSQRGRGYGSALLKEILDEADRCRVTLYLQIAASGGLTNGQLRAWYERHGFKMHVLPKWGEHWVRTPRYNGRSI